MVKQYEDSDVQQAHDQVYEQDRAVLGVCFPPGMTEVQFGIMVHSLKSIVGNDHVHTGQSLLHFSDPFCEHTRHLPSAAVW